MALATLLAWPSRAGRAPGTVGSVFGSIFRRPFSRFLTQLWVNVSVLFDAFFVLQQDFVKTPFLKDVPSEIAVLGFSGVPKNPLKTSPEQGPKRTLKQ